MSKLTLTPKMAQPADEARALAWIHAWAADPDSRHFVDPSNRDDHTLISKGQCLRVINYDDGVEYGFGACAIHGPNLLERLITDGPYTKLGDFPLANGKVEVFRLG